MKTHYFDKDGFPLDPESIEFGKLNQKSKDHTRYFFNNGYSIQKLPNPGKPVGEKNSVLKYFSPGNVQSAEKAEEDINEPCEKRQRCGSEDTAGCSGKLKAGDTMHQRDTCEEVSGNDEENDEEEMELQRRLNVLRGHDATEEHNMEPQISSGGDDIVWQESQEQVHLDPGTSLPHGAQVETDDGGGEVNNNEVEVVITDVPSYSEDTSREDK